MMASSDGAEEPLPDESDMQVCVHTYELQFVQGAIGSLLCLYSFIQGLQRVFLHPGNASVLAADNGAAPNFSSRSYLLLCLINFGWLVGSFLKCCRYLLFSGCHITSKAFVNEVTEIRPYSLLFFGSNLDVNYTNGVVEIDGWIR